ncbi:MAG: DUF21 domain-containing protein [Planctomycetales bacterium]|nr:DUF21 domain-containing protein [Planctomycetales bacterium]
MSDLQQFLPFLMAMVLLGAGSGFFSCSEAALFSLKADDRRILKNGSQVQRLAIAMLDHPNRLLTAILFWNLIINIVYFALASTIGIQLERQGHRTEAGVVAIVSLLAIILFSEMVPKMIGVLFPRSVTGLVSFPLAVAVRAFDPIAPALTAVNQALRRLLFPDFRIEPYLELTDLEKAITISTADEELAAQERTALQNIVLLSDLRAEELMRPRTQYRLFRPPVSLSDLGGQLTRSGYLLLTEADSDEVAGAIALKHMPTIPRQHLERFAQPVVYVPWCATVAAVFDELRSYEREVAAIVNELGETIGIVTLEDLLQTVFEDEASRSSRLLETLPIRQLGENLWQVTGITSLRRLRRSFNIDLPPSKSTTIAGIVQEVLGRFPVEGDEFQWHVFRFKVLAVDQLGQLTVELQRTDSEGGVL